MAGDFPSLSYDNISRFPNANTIDPIARPWFPAYACTLTVASSLVVGARLWSQIKRSTDGFGLDDALSVCAWIFAVLVTVTCTIGTLRHGFDRHLWDVPHTSFTCAALIQWLSEGAYLLSVCFTKASILCFFRRLEPPCTKTMRRIACVLIALTTCYCVSCLLTQIFLCVPTAAYWQIPVSANSTVRNCTSQHVYYPVQGAMDCFLTLCSIIIPVSVLQNRPMSKFQRTGLKGITVAGFGVLGAGIARTVFLTRLTDSVNGDATWNGFNVFVCAQLECHLGLICSSLPYLQRYTPHYPNRPITFYIHGKERNNSVVSRVGSSLSGPFKRLPFGRSSSPREMEISRPQLQAMEIPDWELRTLESPRRAFSPTADEMSYDRYVMGHFGPPAPPKDLRFV